MGGAQVFSVCKACPFLSSALFQCRVTGVPQPVIEWRRSDGSLFTQNTEILDGVLRFNTVTGDEDGVYICNVSLT